jgi:hypothetical protein
LALHMVILHLCAAARPLKPVSGSSRQTLRGWAVVAPRHFHFTITALTVDGGSSSRADIWQTDLLERWKSLSSSVRTFYCQCVSMEIAWLCDQFYTPINNGVAEIA